MFIICKLTTENADESTRSYLEVEGDDTGKPNHVNLTIGGENIVVDGEELKQAIDNCLNNRVVGNYQEKKERKTLVDKIVRALLKNL